MPISAVLFDWRGTLVTTAGWREQIEQAFSRTGRDAAAREVDEILAAVLAADPSEARLDAPGIDADQGFHRSTYLSVFSDAGLDREIAEALYAVESDYRHNPFASDAASTLSRLQRDGIRIAVVSDIHFDVRPAFAAAGLGGVVDAFVLSYEVGVQKPDPLMFTTALDRLGATAESALMVGDRSCPDGGAVECGIATLLLPPLRDVDDCRLDRVLRLLQSG